MRYLETFICMKCGRSFIKGAGGLVTTPKEMELRLHPVCDRCKINAVFNFFKPKK